MRRFWLENNSGKLWDLTPRNPYETKSSFMGEPDGLAIKTKITSYEVDNTCFIEDIETQTQTITGKIYFSSYEHFTKFIDFIGNINTKTPMKLYYSTNNVSFNNKLESEWYK